MPDSSLIETQIIDLTHDAQGVADVDGRRYFVRDALPGEQVRIAPRRARRRLKEAELVEVVDASSDRVTPQCEYFGRCGGCALQHLSYPAQVAFKEHAVKETLARVGGVTPEEWLAPIIGPQWHYRRRARLGAKFVETKGRVLVGFRERAAPYITDMAHCRVLVEPMDSLLGELAAEIQATRIKRRLPQIEFAAGDIRAAVACEAARGSGRSSVPPTGHGAAALVLRVLDRPNDPDCERFLAFGERHDVDIYLQPGGPGTVAALNPEAARALAYRLDDFDVTLGFLPTDFIQINAVVNRQMVAAAIELADVKPTDRVLDLYCGLGNFSLPLARTAAEVVGVEGEAGLVARAVANATANGIDNARFVTANLAESGWGFYREAWDLAVLDPPRTGAAAPVEELVRLKPRRIVYVSCHPATLARDAKVLVAAGYRLRAARALDMFPHTHHVEAMSLFEL